MLSAPPHVGTQINYFAIPILAALVFYREWV